MFLHEELYSVFRQLAFCLINSVTVNFRSVNWTQLQLHEEARYKLNVGLEIQTSYIVFLASEVFSQVYIASRYTVL